MENWGVKLFNKIANKYNLHKEDRKDLMDLEVGSSNVDDSDKYVWYKIYFKFIHPDTNEEMILYPQLIADAKDLSMIFDRSISYMAQNGGSGNGDAIFYGDIPLDLSCRYNRLYNEFLYINSVGVRLNKYNYDIIDYGSGVPMSYITTKSQYESEINSTISEWLKDFKRKYDDKYLQYLHIIIVLSIIASTYLSDYTKNIYNNYRYVEEFSIISELKNKYGSEYIQILAEFDEFIFIEPTTKEELLQIAKEQVENYINNN